MVPLDTLPDSLAELMADPSAWTADLAEGLIGKARSLKGTNLRAAREIAEAAVAVAGKVDDADQSIEALSVCGEIARASADWARARSFYSLVSAFLGSDQAPPGDHRRIALDLRMAMLMRDVRSFGEAERLAKSGLDRAIGGGHSFLARSGLTVLASTLAQCGKLAEGARVYKRAYEMADVGGVGFHRWTTQAYALASVDVGELDRAAGLLTEADGTAGAAEDATYQASASWTRGRLCSVRGRYIPAREFLEDAARQMIELDRPAYAGACLMDLAMLHLEHGRADRAAKLSADLWALFGRLKVDREAFAAVKLYTEAAAAERLTVQMAGAIKRALELAAPNIPPLHAY